MTAKEKSEGDKGVQDASSGDGASTRRRTSTTSRSRATASPKARARGSKAAAAKSAKSSASGPKTSVSSKSKRKRAASAAPKLPTTPPRLLARFREETVPALTKEFGYISPMQVPRLSKIVVNIGLGEALQNPRALENAGRDLALITGQRPVTTRARRSIAGFKIRDGMAIGLMVTLRGRRMYEFFDRLVSSSLPRIRDFRGLSREAFDGRGNYSLGIREHVIFPEIDYNSIDRIRGLQVGIVTTASTDREGLRLLEQLGMPFVRPETDSVAA